MNPDPDILNTNLTPLSLDGQTTLTNIFGSILGGDFKEKLISADLVKKDIKDGLLDQSYEILIPCLLLRLESSGIKITLEALSLTLMLLENETRMSWSPGNIVLIAYALKRLVEKHRVKSIETLHIINSFSHGLPLREAFQLMWDSQKINGENWLDTRGAWEYNNT